MNQAVAVKNSVLAALATFGICIANALGGWGAALALLSGRIKKRKQMK